MDQVNWMKVAQVSLVIVIVLALLCHMGVDKSKCPMLQSLGGACQCIRKKLLGMSEQYVTPPTRS
jgi:hypothetical protein